MGDLERAVPERLREHPPGAPQFDRGDVTTVLNALRCGVEFDGLLAIAQAVRPERLLWAYQHVERLRSSAADGFDLIVGLGGELSPKVVARASNLVPVPVSRLVAAAEGRDAARVEEARLEVVALAAAVSKRSAELEATVVALVAAGRRPEAVVCGRRLYDPYGACVWGHPFFVPRRVGELMPARVRDLLEERSA